jgi:hypothetical protein
MFGYSEEQIATFGLTFGVGGFMLYMLFIMVGFVAKYIIQWYLEK